jgi:hypothetical protein
MLKETRNGLYLKNYFAWVLRLKHELFILVYFSVYIFTHFI